MLGPSAKLNIHFMEHWWKLDQLEMPSRRSSVCIVFCVNVADVTSVKQADLWKFTLREHVQPDPRSAWKIKVGPTCIQGRPQNMLERCEGAADWAKHHPQEIQGICPHVSGSSTQLGHLLHLDSHHWSISQRTKTLACKLFLSYVGTTQMPLF
jgi:hypothetical protein